MTLLAVFGAFATAVGLTRAIPQLLRLWRLRDAHGVSLDAAATTTVVSFGWTMYALVTDQPAVSISSGSSGVMFGLVALTALRFGRRVSELRITPIWSAALLTAWISWEAPGLGYVLPISVLVANGPQLRVAWVEKDLTALSLGTWVLSVVEGFAWGAYGFFVEDGAVLLYGVLHFSTSASICALKIARS